MLTAPHLLQRSTSPSSCAPNVWHSARGPSAGSFNMPTQCLSHSRTQPQLRSTCNVGSKRHCRSELPTAPVLKRSISDGSRWLRFSGASQVLRGRSRVMPRARPQPWRRDLASHCAGAHDPGIAKPTATPGRTCGPTGAAVSERSRHERSRENVKLHWSSARPRSCTSPPSASHRRSGRRCEVDLVERCVPTASSLGQQRPYLLARCAQG